VSAARYISKAWLTYGFGIAPMISDAKKASESIKEFLLRNDHSVTLSGSATKSWRSGGRTVNDINGIAATDLVCHSNINHSLSYQYKGGFNFLLSSGSDYGALDHFGISAGDLVPTAWELVPFSWVIDYFTTAGDYLDDTFTGTPVKLLYLNQTRKYQALGTNRLEHVLRKPVTLKNFSQKTGTCSYQYTEFERTVLTALPHRILRFKTVDEVAIHSLDKLFNLVSVMNNKSGPMWHYF
jgi:hypothetical protein